MNPVISLEDRRRRAEELVKTTYGRALTVFKIIASAPSLTDKQVADRLHVSSNCVAQARRAYHFPQAPTVKVQQRLDQAKQWEKYCQQDNADLDRGVCRVNLHDDEERRYLDIRLHKERGVPFVVPATK